MQIASLKYNHLNHQPSIKLKYILSYRNEIAAIYFAIPHRSAHCHRGLEQ